MTGTPAARARERMQNPHHGDGASEIRVQEAIEQRASELADQAPPLTSDQISLLKAIFSHRSGGGS